jgi:type IV secretory pathway VirB10-like protein
MSMWTPQAEQRLSELVAQYGTRWSVISASLARQFGFSCSGLECSAHHYAKQKRAESELRQKRPASAARRHSAPAAMQLVSPKPSSPTKQPFGELSPNTKKAVPAIKRWREQPETEALLQPRTRAPSPPAVTVLSHECPMYLLAPGSSMGLDPALRRQLKAMYLATKLKYASESGEAATAEKAPVVSLLSRELTRLKGGGAATAELLASRLSLSDGRGPGRPRPPSQLPVRLLGNRSVPGGSTQMGRQMGKMPACSSPLVRC